MKNVIYLLSVIVCASNCWGVSFDGAAGVFVEDPDGALSWDEQKNALSVSCWFRISVPSGSSISSDMVILSDRTSGNKSSDPFAYLIQVNAVKGNVEFVQNGTNSSISVELIEHPYIDRWYHVAVVLSGDLIYPYIDGEALPSIYASNEDVSNTNGVSIGCWGGGNFFRGEIQEVGIFQSSIAYMVNELKFLDIPPEYHSFLSLNGYFKLGEKPEGLHRYVNYSANPPNETEYGTKIGNGTITFDSPDTAVEQSLFDANKNGGENAVVPLSGAFTWRGSALNRPVTGIPFSFDFGYSSAVALFSTADDGLQPAVLSPGWRHSFEMRMSPTQSSTERQIITPSGAVDTWDRTPEGFVTRHKRYRGSLRKLDNDDYEWTSPELLKYRFYDPTYSAVPWEHQKRGRLYEIEDRNKNKIQIHWNGFIGVVEQVVDTVQGVYDFEYNAQNLLTNVSYNGWGVNFAYSNNLLSATWRTAPSEYEQKDTLTKFEYDEKGLLVHIYDPGHTNTSRIVEYDNHGRVVSETDALLRKRTVAYGKPSGRDISRTDAAGNLWIESYDRKHRLVERSDPLGNIAGYTYDGIGNKVSETDPRGNTTYYAYDEHSNLIATTNPLGVVSRWLYDLDLNEVTNQVDTLGWETASEYDAKGNLLRRYDGYGDLFSRSYAANGLMLSQTDANGNINQYDYTPAGFLLSATDPEGNATVYSRNELGWVLATTNSLSEVTSYQFDLNGNIVRVEDALGNVVTQAYDENNNKILVVDARGNTISNSYDVVNQLVLTTDADGAEYRRTYTELGSLSAVIDPLGNTTSNIYDNAGRAVSSVDPIGRISRQEYDANGNVVKRIDPLGNEWVVTYDPLNRVLEQKDSQGNVVRTGYDELGRKKAVTSPKGYVSEYEYDSRSRLVRWFDPEGGEWSYQYDNLLNITNVSDALGGQYVMEYGARNERIMERNQDGFEWHYLYDPLLRLEQITDPNGLVKDYTYDAGGYLQQVSFSSGRTDAYEYDANGNPTNIVRQSGVESVATVLEYDPLNRVGAVVDTFGNRVAYGRDLRGQITAMTYPDGLVISNSFNEVGQVVRQVDWENRTTEYEYDAANRIVGKTFPNGIVQTNGFDDAGRLSGLAYRKAQQQLIGYQFDYDANGNLLTSTEEGAVPFSEPAEFDEQLEYTAANRLISKEDSASLEDYLYFYDDSGNMTNMASPSSSYSFEYDEDNRVVRVEWITPSTNVVVENKYDALGRRIAKTVNGVEFRYVLDLAGSLERILVEQDAAGAIQKYHAFGASGLDYSVEPSGDVQYYQHDNIGNVVLVTDTNATASARYSYSPYGKVLSAAGEDKSPFKFVGHLGIMEELPNLYFMRARYYSADTGSFLSTDPMKKIGPGWTPIAYWYANGNPLKYVDPDGEVVVLATVAAVAVIGAYVGIPIAVMWHDAFNDPMSKDVGEDGFFLWRGATDVVSASAGVGLGEASGGDLGPSTLDLYSYSHMNRNKNLKDRRGTLEGSMTKDFGVLNDEVEQVGDTSYGKKKSDNRRRRESNKGDNVSNDSSGGNGGSNNSGGSTSFLDAIKKGREINNPLFGNGMCTKPSPPKPTLWDRVSETTTKIVDNVKNWWSKLF